MSLKFVLDNLDGVADELAPHYSVSDDGKFYLGVEGAVSKKKLDEFRNNNIELNKKLEGFASVDMEEYSKLQEMALKGSKYTDDDVNLMVDERVKSMKFDFEKQATGLNDTLNVTKSQLESLLVDSAVRQASATLGVQPSATDDVVLRAKSTFKVVEGAAVPHDTSGNIIYGKDGDSPMSVKEWVKGLKMNAAHLFIQSQGSGLNGNGSGGGRVDTSKMSPLQKIQHSLESS